MDKTSKPKKVNLFLTFASDTDRGLKKLFANKWQVCAAKLAKHGANYASSAFLGKKKIKIMFVMTNYATNDASNIYQSLILAKITVNCP